MFWTADHQFHVFIALEPNALSSVGVLENRAGSDNRTAATATLLKPLANNTENTKRGLGGTIPTTTVLAYFYTVMRYLRPAVDGTAAPRHRHPLGILDNAH